MTINDDDIFDGLFHHADYRIMPTGVRRVDASAGESRVDFAA
ncbi:MAG: hypothetical protein ACLQIB_01635 [Isosphaeraceae bacterium]